MVTGVYLVKHKYNHGYKLINTKHVINYIYLNGNPDYFVDSAHNFIRGYVIDY